MEEFSKEEKLRFWTALSHLASQTEITVGLVLLFMTAFGIVVL